MPKALNNLDEIQFKDIWSKIDQIEGLLIPGQEKWLFETAKSLPDGARILEIGSYEGRSTVSLAYGCLGTRKHVFTIDKFKGVYQDVENLDNLRPIFEKGFYNEWKENIEKNNLQEYVTPFAIDSKEMASAWKAQIHMLFIDGSHQYEDVIADFNNFYPFVVPNGIIGIHDVIPNWAGCYKAWNEYIKNRLQDTGAVSSLAYGIKKNNVRSRNEFEI